LDFLLIAEEHMAKLGNPEKGTGFSFSPPSEL
jgi:hypothetical protein